MNQTSAIVTRSDTNTPTCNTRHTQQNHNLQYLIGVDKQDGWTLGAKGISKHGAEQKRTTARRTQKLVKEQSLEQIASAHSVQDRIGAEGFVQAGYEVKHYEGRQESYDEEARCKLEEQRSLALGWHSRGHREQSVHP
jgi:hypothetical protein